VYYVGGDYVTVVGWDDRGESALIRPCVHYNWTTGRFRVFQDGLYIVISQLAFNSPRSAVYGQKVYMYNANDDDGVLSGV